MEKLYLTIYTTNTKKVVKVEGKKERELVNGGGFMDIQHIGQQGKC